MNILSESFAQLWVLGYSFKLYICILHVLFGRQLYKHWLELAKHNNMYLIFIVWLIMSVVENSYVWWGFVRCLCLCLGVYVDHCLHSPIIDKYQNSFLFLTKISGELLVQSTSRLATCYYLGGVLSARLQFILVCHGTSVFSPLYLFCLFQSTENLCLCTVHMLLVLEIKYRFCA